MIYFVVIALAILLIGLVYLSRLGAERRGFGVLMNTTSDDVEGQARIAAFVQRLQQLGWTGGHNTQIDIRWGGGAYDRFQQYAAELAAQKPE
jgi:hypothetical protein